MAGKLRTQSRSTEAIPPPGAIEVQLRSGTVLGAATEPDFQLRGIPKRVE